MGSADWGHETASLPPWMLRFTIGGDYGIHLICNTGDRESGIFPALPFCFLVPPSTDEGVY